MSSEPVILEWFNRQRRVQIDIQSVGTFVGAMLPSIVGGMREGAALGGLRAVEIVLVSDRVMRRVHRDFLGEDSTTDVVTFEHGELVIGAEVAERRAVEYRTTKDREVALYALHGLLHLAGYDDHTPGEAAEMDGLQKKMMRHANGFGLQFPSGRG